MLAEATNPRKRFGSQSHLCQPNRIKFTGYLNLINLAFIAEIVLVGFFFSENVWIFQQLLQLILIETKKSELFLFKQKSFPGPGSSNDVVLQRTRISQNKKTALASKLQPYRSSNLGQNDHHCHMGGNDKNTAKWREARCKPRFRVQTEQLRCAFLCVW